MKKILYLGTDPTFFKGDGEVIHYPMIRLVPRSIQDPIIQTMLTDIEFFTHLLFTSKNAVRFFLHLLALGNIPKDILQQKQCICVGKVTAHHLEKEGIIPAIVAKEETQEGVIAELEEIDLASAYVCFPRSSLSRPSLVAFFVKSQIRFLVCTIYDTVPYCKGPRPHLDTIEEIVFTSPSTVEAFFQVFGMPPSHVQCACIGPITEKAFKAKFPSYPKSRPKSAF